jgi:phage terminase small subunit
MNEKELTAKEEAFCVAYTTIGNETFSNGAKSAEEAGYAENSARTQAWRMLRKEHIKKRNRELLDKNMEENMVTVGSVLANLAHDRLMARKHNQYSVAKSCTELEGKYLAMFTENINQTIEEPREYSEEEKAILREAGEKMVRLNLKVHEPGYGETPEDHRREIAERNVG